MKVWAENRQKGIAFLERVVNFRVKLWHLNGDLKCNKYTEHQREEKLSE
jgi:hypothetical protein